MRVLMVCPRFPPYVGGVEVHVYEVARRLVLRGLDVTVLTADRERSLPREEFLEGIGVIRVAAWPRRRDYSLAPAMVNVIGNSQCDVMHLHSHHTLVAPLAMAAASRSRLPFVVTFHGMGHQTSLRGPLRPLQVRLLRPLLAQAERLVALNHAERDRFRALLRLPAERFVVIPNGGDRLVEHDGEQESYVPPPGRGPLIVSIGRLERFKGHHRLVAALPLMVERYPGVQLAIVGEGPERDGLAALAARLGVAERVEIRALPLADRSAMAACLRSASVVALLSEGEGQPLTLLEAAALERPLLVTDAPGLRQLLDASMATGVRLQASSHEVAHALSIQLERPLIPRRMDVPMWEDTVDALLEVYAAAAESRVASVAGRRERDRYG